MDEDQIKIIFISLILIGTIFCGISLLIPWADQSIGNTPIATYYAWGTASKIPISPGVSNYFFMTHSTITGLPNLPQGTVDEIKPFAIAFLFLALSFILAIITLIFGIITIYSITNKNENKVKSGVFNSAITAIIVILIFYIMLSFFISFPFDSLFSNYLSSLGGLNFVSNLTFSVGFYLFLFGAVFFSVGVGLNKYLLEHDIEMKTETTEDEISEDSSDTSEDKAYEIVRLRYAKGEITKEEYEQIKKDISDKK